MEGCFAGIAQQGAEWLGTGAVAGGATAAGLFNYNRENFLYDREQRRRKEFKLMNFRLEQASLWREDVRDLISLTEYKMHVYLLVNVLMLGFTVVLWCEGRLPDTTPDWLMMGSSLAITGSFVFLLLSIWLAMHAAIAAQSYETRLVTQMVRLPIPSWQEIEACRTYSSAFERVEPRQMFRVPWVMGRQENLVRRPAADEAASPAESPRSPSPRRGPVDASASRASLAGGGRPGAADPWGLERRGDDIEELGCKHGSDVSKLRHIVIARHAMAHWQSHDAFARISMSVGVSQLLLAMSYYILGYILVQVGCRTAATYGVILLTVMSDTIMRLDMSLKDWQLRAMRLLLVLGPTMSCLAAYHWSSGSYIGIRTAEGYIVVSFLAHSLYLGLMTMLCRIKQQDNGTMLPVAFRSVLYLDVFGWLRVPRRRATPPPQPHLSRTREESMDRRAMTHNFGLHPEPSYQPEPLERSSAGQISGMLDGSEPDVAQPASNNVRYEHGQAVPTRPEDVAGGHGSCNADMRHEPGALEPGTSGSAFFDPKLWMSCEDEYDMDALDSLLGAERIEPPGMLPWRIFCFTMLTLCFCWLAACIYHILGAAEVWDLDPPMLFEAPPAYLQGDHLLPPVRPQHTFLGMLSRHPAEGQTHTIQEQVEHISVSWPVANIAPRTMSCDEDGHHFVFTDGVLMFAGEVSSSETEPRQGPEARPKRSHKLFGRRQRGRVDLHAVFEEILCEDVLGESIEDTAVICESASRSRCEASVLFHHGKSVTSCKLGPLQGSLELLAQAQANVTRTTLLSDNWLQQLRDSRTQEEIEQDNALPGSPHVNIEKPSNVVVVPGCSNDFDSAKRDGCILIGTNSGHVVQLRQPPKGGQLVPMDTVREPKTGAFVPSGAGNIRALNNRFLAILDHQGTMMHVFDIKNGGVPAGRVKMPQSRSAVAFCAGGGHLYMLGEGPEPEMWRVAMPDALAPDASDGGPRAPVAS